MPPFLKRLLDRLTKRAARPQRGPAPAALGAKPYTHPEDATRWGDAIDNFVPLPNATPFDMLKVYRFLADTIPDISDGIWTWKRLCQTGYTREIFGASSAGAAERAEELLTNLDRRVNTGDRGMDGLLDIVYSSLFTYGAAALEIVLSPNRDSIWDVIPVDVPSIRFKRENGALQAYQLHGGESIKLPMERFIYIGLDRDGTNPYGRSMLRAIPFVIKIQQRLLADMAKATRNAGWTKLHLQYAPEERQRGESEEGYRARMNAGIESLRASATGIETDQNLVTTDNVKVTHLKGDQGGAGFYDNHKAIEEQVITGMHLMPILLGRNYGTTETYGTAQFEIINRQVEAVTRSVKRTLERLYNFELAMLWGEGHARVHMRSNRTVDILRDAQARAQEIQNTAELLRLGYINEDHAKTLLNL